MIPNRQFRITYYSNKDQKHITRNALWTEQSRIDTTKADNVILVYYDLDATGYRTAQNSWSIKY
ncbi:MAG: hypothetical protein MK212_20950 [Saprospiraceae bacterium]|jgi:hypothetical protein|nr:hypothetical protein [Saprospiraceae bacterium]|tara:strand:+ start:147 stop:338 length:192 start_codon:yes stop_codon:yes gene_type:complete